MTNNLISSAGLANFKFGRIRGFNHQDSKPYVDCRLRYPTNPRDDFPEPGVFIPHLDWISCRNTGTQSATIEQMQRAYDAGYEFPCLSLVDGSYRLARKTSECQNNGIKTCYDQTNNPSLCSAESTPVKYEYRRRENRIDKDLVSEGNNLCFKEHGTYLAGKEDLAKAMSVGYKKTTCGKVSNGGNYKVIQNSGSIKAEVKPCTTMEGFFCAKYEFEVMRLENNKRGRKFVTLEDAHEGCKELGNEYHLATLTQLRSAWSQGLDSCDCGFLADGQVKYVVNSPRKGCGTFGAGLRYCPRNPREWSRTGWSAYCSKVPLPIVKNPLESGNSTTAMTVDRDIAQSVCKTQKRAVASFAGMKEAYDNGFRDGRCIVTSNGGMWRYKHFDIESCTAPESFYCTKAKMPVFHLNTTTESYQFANKDAAEQACKARGTTLASEQLLELAFQMGYDQCACGWLSDGSVQYPITLNRTGCGDVEGPGLRSCPINPSMWSTQGWDAYCITI